MVSGSIKKLFSVDCVNIDWINSSLSFLNIILIGLKVWVTPHCIYRDLLTLTLLLVSFQVTFNQHFCRWRCFSFCWFGKRDFGKFTNGIPVTGGSARLPLPRNLALGLLNLLIRSHKYWNTRHFWIILFSWFYFNNYSLLS